MNKYYYFSILTLALLAFGCTKDPFATDNSGSFTDQRDNANYNWVRIGAQIWMSDNLAYLPSVSPNAVASVTSPVYYMYDYQGISVLDAKSLPIYSLYGALYNFEAAKMACPDGWHLPTDAEWKTLEIFLGMTQGEADSTGVRLSGSVGEKLRSKTGWNNGMNGNNSVGFNAQGGGFLWKNGTAEGFGISAAFWTASPGEATTAWDRYLDGSGKGIDRKQYPRSDAYSVRCLRN